MSVDTSTRPTSPTIRISSQREQSEQPASDKRRSRSLHLIAWLCLVLACIGASWFAFQYYLVPQPKYFAPDWHEAQWVSAADTSASRAYFRYLTNLEVVPDRAFVTIAVSQVFSFYVNGILVGSNNRDLGNYPRAYMYEITPSLLLGANALAIRVDNLDNQVPMLRVSLGITIAGVVSYYGTGTGWQSTTQASLVYPQDTDMAVASTAWTGLAFDSSSWSPTHLVTQSPASPSLTVNPLLYEQPLSAQWISSGMGQDAYFVRQVFLPDGFQSSWLRIVSTGTTDIFINGNSTFTWNYRPASVKKLVLNGKTGLTTIKNERGLLLGVYDVSPYLHPGLNTVAARVSLQGVIGTINSLSVTSPALSLDIMMSDDQGHTTWLTSLDGWKISHQAGLDPAASVTTIHDWTSPISISRPNGFDLSFVAGSNVLTSEQQAAQNIPVSQSSEVILSSIFVVLGLWLLVSLLVTRRYFCSRREALEAMSLAYLPALACEGILIVLSREPRIVQPFPYTHLWAVALILMIGAGYALLWLHAYGVLKGGQALFSTRRWAFRIAPRKKNASVPAILYRAQTWLRVHWAIIPLLLLSLPLLFFDLGYEAYWQDELVSYDVAKSILHNGLPMLPSGFIYPKGELYSYLLALVMKLFGDQAAATRLITSVECLLTIALLYRVGCYFFDRRVALLATIMLALSPQELIWSRQVRMYQQAQLLTLLTVFLFYKAIQERQRARRVYLAVGVLILAYLSHEETFIILPALALCVLVVSWVVRDNRHRLPEVFYQKHWWIAVPIGISIIGIQLIIVQVSHPAVLGTDASMRPPVQFTTDNISYYFNILFTPASNYPVSYNNLAITSTAIMSSVCAVLGCFWARRSDSLRVKYIALFLVVSFLTLLFLFTMQAYRYFYPLATFYYLMAAFALMKIMRAIWQFARTRSLRQKSSLVSGNRSLPLKILMALTAALVFLSVLILPMLPLSNYNLFVSRVLNLPYYHHYADYEGAGQYVQQHMLNGDIVISISPDSLVLNYVGRSDYFFSIDHDLFLFEKKGQIVDTYTGHTGLLRQSDLDAVLATHKRIWLVSLESFNPNFINHFIFPPDFHIVYAGIGMIVYLRGG